MNPTPKVRCALYARQSTAEQQSIPAQLEALREYATRRGWAVVDEVADIRSGATRRPKRDALMAAARARQLDAIIVLKLDRWGRSLRDLVTSLDELAELSGGRHYPIDDLNELPRISERIGLELRNQYLLGYSPSNLERDGKYRSIKLNLLPPAGMPTLKAQYRHGYYAPGQ